MLCLLVTDPHLIHPTIKQQPERVPKLNTAKTHNPKLNYKDPPPLRIICQSTLSSVFQFKSLLVTGPHLIHPISNHSLNLSQNLTQQDKNKTFNPKPNYKEHPCQATLSNAFLKFVNKKIYFRFTSKDLRYNSSISYCSIQPVTMPRGDK